MPTNRLSLALSLTVMSLGCAPACQSPTKDGPERFYSLDEIPEFRITLKDKALAKLQKEPREWVKARFEYGGQTLEDVAVRLKGHRSMRPLGKKASFKVRFDKYVDGQRLLGLRRLTLNGMVEDPSMMREILGYRLYRAMGVPAPDVGYARVFVNNEDYGLYALVETVDDVFLARRFEDATGGLYEGEYGCDLYPEDVDGFDKDAGDESDRSDLAALAQAAKGEIEDLMYGERALLDRQQVLAYLAVSAFIGDFDGYRHAHNYRLYHDPSTGQWSLLPWGIDRAFRKSLDVLDSYGLVARKCFASARCRRDYFLTLRRVVERFSSLDLAEGMNVLAALIDPLAVQDPKRPHSSARIRKEREALRAYLRRRAGEVLEQTACLDGAGTEKDADGDGFGCMDCNDAAVRPGAVELCDGIDNDCNGLVDDSPACPCAIVEAEGVAFHVCNLPLSWEEADAFCRRKGMTLARIDSAEQSRALRAAANTVTRERLWIGLHDRGLEGQFQWTDGTPVRFTHWAKREPDNAACNQDCAALRDEDTGTWHDTHCVQPLPFLCR